MAPKTKKEPMIRRNISFDNEIYKKALKKAQRNYMFVSPVVVRLLEMWANDEIALTPRPEQEAEK